MPHSKAQFRRYQILNSLFRRRGSKYTLDSLLEEINSELELNYGKSFKISRRTLQEDIRMMKSPPPDGFNAPIQNIYGTGLYYYSNPGFSILNLPLDKTDKKKLFQAFDLLKQIKGIPQSDYLYELMTRLQIIDQSSSDKKRLIYFEESYYKNGLSFIKPIYDAIEKQKALNLTYQPFNEKKRNYIVFPYFLKEYRNRWYVFCFINSKKIIANLALDRIKEIKPSIKKFEDHTNLLPQDIFENIIGVTLPPKESALTEITLKVFSPTLFYLRTKPLHSSQKLLKLTDDYAIFSYHIYINFEFEAEIMRLSDAIEILSPDSLRKSLREKLKVASKLQR